MLAIEPRVAKACTRAAQYVLSRQCASGGFCFYRSEHIEEPNLADTHHAVATLKLLGHVIPRLPDLVAFLDRFPPSGQPAHLYYLLESKHALDPAFRPAERFVRLIRNLRLNEPSSSSDLTGWLERARLIVQLKREYAEPVEGARMRRWLERVSRDGGFGSRPNLRDTWLALEILETCNDVGTWPQIADFVDRLQMESCGFSDTVVSRTANIDVIFAGVRCCGLLALPIRYPHQALRFALQCQTGNGGFSRAPDALPSIEYTYEAICTVLSLSVANA